MFKRPIYSILLKRLEEPRRYIQVLAGPRQVGKTTLIQQVMEKLTEPVIYVSADEATMPSPIWIHQQWDLARLTAKKNPGTILVLDEIQKIPDWSTTVKKCWDEDTRHHVNLKIVLLGSAPLLIHQGLIESLAGRFEQISITHWNFLEMQEAFGWSLDQYIYFGGYPGSAALIKEDESRWKRYVHDALIETTLSRDILLLNPIHKPALLRQLFQLSCDYSSQILSYQKMLGQLHDAGNTTTLAHYLQLLKGIGMVTGLEKYTGKSIRQRSSSPKLQVFNTALISACSHYSFQEAQKNRDYWGRLVESAVGAYLLNNALGENIPIYYWREHDKEVDFVLQVGKKLIVIEVKSQYKKGVHSGTAAFCQHFKTHRTLLVGGEGLPIETFLSTPLKHWIE